MATRPSLRQRLGYFFDTTISKSPLMLLVWLGAVCMIIVLVVSLVVWALSSGLAGDVNLFAMLWEIFFQVITPNPVEPGAGPWAYLAGMLLITFVSLFGVSVLIGTLANTIQDKFDELRKGRSRVLESDHTVILGWSSQIFTIIAELVMANESRQKRTVIAILADQDKVNMESDIRDRVPDTKNTRVICRSGNPIDPIDLEIVSPHTARAIIVLPPECEDPDSHVIKAVLAITNNPNRHDAPCRIVTEIRNLKTREVLKILGAKDQIRAVLMNDLIARITAQTSRQSGLSLVYSELLDFSGDEIYFQEEPSLVGKTFGDALLAYEDSAVIGLRRADGQSTINPSMEMSIQPGDQLLVLSADDDTVRVSGLSAYPIDESLIRQPARSQPANPERLFILGWNRCGTTLVHELDGYVANGSQITVVADPNISPAVRDVGDEIAACRGELANLEVVFRQDDTTDRRLLDALQATLDDHVIVLGYEGLSVQEADTKTLTTLLHLRDVAEKSGRHFTIVSEMLDLRNRQLAEVTHADDFIVSDHLVSLMLAQLSENIALYEVFDDLFDPEGSEIYLKSARDYVATGQLVNFYTVIEAARRRGEVAIGYRLMHEADVGPWFGFKLNPKKSEPVRFDEQDRVVLLAE